jgi:GH25 family lysozyme M1 (1,4-beta-N-acetylmuramidase)
MIRLIDISHHQGNINFEKVKSDGYVGVIQKCTEGSSFKDNMYSGNKEKIRNIGLLFGAYHFCRGGDAKKEAKHFCDNIGELKNGDLLVMDYEIKTLSDPASWCKIFSDYVESKLGVKLILYTYHSLLKAYNWKVLSDNGNKLWAARYGLQEQEPNENYKPVTGSFGSYIMWQYCSRGKVSGISGSVDLDCSELTPDELKSFGYKGEESDNVPSVASSMDFCYNQSNYPNVYLGNSSKYTIASDGCLLTSVTSVYQYLTGKEITPPEMNEKLKSAGCFVGASLVFPKVCEVLGWNYVGKYNNINATPESMGVDTPTIKEVDYSYRPKSQQHFVVRVHTDKENYILDPLGGVKRKINYYEKLTGDTNWKTGYFSYRVFN